MEAKPVLNAILITMFKWII